MHCSLRRMPSTAKLPCSRLESVPPAVYGSKTACQSIAKLLTLQPDDPLITRWAVQARDQVVQLAHKRLQEHQYRLAVELLRSIPEQVVDAKVTDWRQQACRTGFPVVGNGTCPDDYRSRLCGQPKGCSSWPRRTLRPRNSSGTWSVAFRPRATRPPRLRPRGRPVPISRTSGRPWTPTWRAPALHYADAETRRRFRRTARAILRGLVAWLCNR